MAKRTRDRRKGKSNRKKRDKQGTRSGQAGSQQKPKATMVLQRNNYLLLLLGVALIIIGYVLMRRENEVDGFISLYVAPLIILGGYLEVIYAILWRPKEQKAEVESATEAE